MILSPAKPTEVPVTSACRAGVSCAAICSPTHESRRGESKGSAPPIHYGVVLTVLFRVVGLLVALCLSLSGAGLSVVHGMNHAHEAREHGVNVTASPFAVPTVEDGEHGHDHEHAVIDVAVTRGDDTRSTELVAMLMPTCQRSPTRTEIASPTMSAPPLLLRPGPETGPQCGPRAPPLS